MYPFAAAIDTPLPTPPGRTYLLLDSKTPWVEADAQPNDKQFQAFAEESLAQWRARLGLAC